MRVLINAMILIPYIEMMIVILSLIGLKTGKSSLKGTAGIHGAEQAGSL